MNVETRLCLAHCTHLQGMYRTPTTYAIEWTICHFTIVQFGQSQVPQWCSSSVITPTTSSGKLYLETIVLRQCPSILCAKMSLVLIQLSERERGTVLAASSLAAGPAEVLAMLLAGVNCIVIYFLHSRQTRAQLTERVVTFELNCVHLNHATQYKWTHYSQQSINYCIVRLNLRYGFAYLSVPVLNNSIRLFHGRYHLTLSNQSCINFSHADHICTDSVWQSLTTNKLLLYKSLIGSNLLCWIRIGYHGTLAWLTNYANGEY